jgi:hypothetical protein
MEIHPTKFKAEFEVLVRLFSCRICKRKYADEKSLNKHNVSIHRAKAACKDCERKFKGQTQLEEHIKRKHLNVKDVLCYICEKGFVNKADLNTHQTSVHSEERPYKCDECSSSFKRVSTLYTHKRYTHTKLKPFPCPVCKKCFKTKGSSVKCVEKHSLDGKQYKCTFSECAKTLSTKEGIGLHIKNSHAENIERPKCDTCSKDFSSTGDLKRHIKFIHIKPEKKFQCLTCPTKCHTKGQFERHLEIHEGKSFECPQLECTTKRNTQYDLNHHIKKKHGKVNHKKNFIPVEERPLIECEKCGKKMKPGASPIHTLKLHMERHAKERVEACIFTDCKFELLDKDPKYYYAKEMNTHMLEDHHLALTNWIVLYKCIFCNLQVLPAPNQTLKGKSLKDSLIEHMFTHDEATLGRRDSKVTNRFKIDKFAREWSRFYERTIKLENVLIKGNVKQDRILPLSVEEYERAFADIMRRTPFVNICKT